MAQCVPNLEKQFLVRTFYRFTPLPPEELESLQEVYREAGRELELCGSIILSTEGCNGTIAGDAAKVDEFFSLVKQRFPDLKGQDSHSPRPPYKRWRVPIKRHIVQARDTELRPAANHSGQKTPQEWDQIRELVREGRAQMIDVRNCYEVGIGTFPEAIDPDTTTFKQFADFLDHEVGGRLDPDLPTAIFCTGGIRCEKARLDLEQRGFGRVWQLKGGILKYLKETDDPGFEGECFVFDERVAVDRKLEPSSNYKLCPSCGGPAPIDGEGHRCIKGRGNL